MNKNANKEFTKDWKYAYFNNDGCSSGPLKYVARFFLKRNYACFCRDHDFDYGFGWKYGVNRKQADKYLREGIVASGHPKIARLIYWGVRIGGSSHYNKGI